VIGIEHVQTIAGSRDVENWRTLADDRFGVERQRRDQQGGGCFEGTRDGDLVARIAIANFGCATAFPKVLEARKADRGRRVRAIDDADAARREHARYAALHLVKSRFRGGERDDAGAGKARRDRGGKIDCQILWPGRLRRERRDHERESDSASRHGGRALAAVDDHGRE